MEDEDISLGLNSNEELVSVQGQDGQQYVVLEVIQLEVLSGSIFFFVFFCFFTIQQRVFFWSNQGEGGDEDEATMMEVEGATEMDGSLIEGEGNTMTSLDGRKAIVLCYNHRRLRPLLFR